MSRKLNRTLVEVPSSSQFPDKQSSIFSVHKPTKEPKHAVIPQDLIVRLKQQNRRLKDMRDNLISKKRAVTLMEKNSNDRDQNYWKRQLDKLKFLAKSKKLVIKSLTDKIKKIEQRGEVDQDNPIARSIRILQNKLDKTMIKYNQAVGMKQTYDHLTNRLKQQRINYENQLNIIQSTLKGKQHDFQELTLLSHDAGHARQMAQIQLKQFQNKKANVRNLREKFMNERKQDILKTRLTIPRDKLETSTRIQVQRSFEHQDTRIESDQEQQLAFYQSALKKLVEVSGGNNAEEIIEKFRAQSQTNKSMQELEENYKIKLQYLKTSINQNKQILKSNLVVGGNKQDKKIVDQMQINANKILNDCQKIKTKFSKTNKLIVNATAGLEHLLQNFNQTTESLSKLDFQTLLENVYQKLIQHFEEVSRHPNFKPKMLQDSKTISSKQDTKKAQALRRSETNREKQSDIEYQEAKQQQEMIASKTKNIISQKPSKNNILSISGTGRTRKSLRKS